MRKLIYFSVVLLGLLPYSRAQASLTTVLFSGEVISVDAGLAGGGIVANDVLTGTYTFESTTAPNGGSTSDFAVFDALTQLSVDVGLYSGLSAAGAEIQQDGDAQPNRYAVVSRTSQGLTPLAIGDYDLVFFGFRMDGGASIPDARDLTQNVNLANFNSSQFFLFFENRNNALDTQVVFGELNDVHTTPEPASLAVWSVLGLVGGLGAWKRRRA